MRGAEVARLLPEIMGRTNGNHTPLAAVLETMVSLLDPADRRLKQLDAWFDPYRAPDGMVPYLAAWVDLAWLPVRAEVGGEGLTTERLRALIAHAPRLAATRGTAAGLQHFLAIALDQPSIKVRDTDVGRPFHVVVELPAVAAADRRLADLIIRFEKPVHLTHEVSVV
ncbi:MAG TPA: phage tail protein [Gemmatimonadales bacterium]|nr:phage tail protein [Gemmatimonadales bacterium]